MGTTGREVMALNMVVEEEGASLVVEEEEQFPVTSHSTVRACTIVELN
jgi:hypothetical protein